MSSMRSAKGVVYINFSQICKLLSKIGIIFLFLSVESQVFQKDYPIFRAVYLFLDVFTNAIIKHLHRFA